MAVSDTSWVRHRQVVQIWTVRLIGILAVASSALPFVVIKGFSHPFLTPRELVLRTIALLLAPLLVTEWVMRGAPYRLGLLGKAVVGICLAAGISTLFSVDPHGSFWGSAERLNGFVTILEIVLLGLAYKVTLSAGRNWRRMLLVVFGLAWGTVAAWAIAERFVPGFWWQFNGGGGRSVSVFGNSIFLANGLLLYLFLSLTVSFAVWKTKYHLWLVTLLIVFLGVSAIVSTETRGAFVGLAAGALVAVGAVLLSSARRVERVLGMLLPVLVVAAIGVLWLTRDMPVPTFVPGPISRVMTLFSTTDPSRLQRFQLWAMGWRAFQTRPITGWGLEQFDTALDRVFDPYLTRYGVANSYSDRVHNGFLDIAAVAGMAGVGAFLFFFFALLGTIRRLHKNKKFPVFVTAFAYGGVAAYATSLLTAFDTHSTFLVLALATAALSWSTAIPSTPAQRSLPKLLWLGAGVVAAGVSVWVLWYGVVPVIYASITVNRAVVTTSGEELLATARTIHTFEQPYRAYYELRIANEIFKAVGDATPRGQQVEALLTEAALLLRDAQARRPAHFATSFTLANVLLLQAGYGMIPMSEVQAALLSARALAPRRQLTYYQLGNAFLLSGDKQAAQAEFEAALALNPDVPESIWHLARYWASVEEWETAGVLYERAVNTRFGGDRPSVEYGQAINALLRSGRLESARVVYILWIERFTPTADILASYAALSAELGYRDDALSALRQALLLDPSLQAEVPAFLERYGFPSDAVSSISGNP